MGVEISGLDDFEKMLAEAEKRQRGAADRFLKQQAELLLGTVRDKTPTKTKQIALAWARTQPHDNMIDVYNNTKYAAHVAGFQESGKARARIGSLFIRKVQKRA